MQIRKMRNFLDFPILSVFLSGFSECSIFRMKNIFSNLSYQTFKKNKVFT